MVAEPKPKAAAKKKRRRAAREEFADYVVEIEGWDWGYSLSLNTENRTSEVPFWELTEFVEPSKGTRDRQQGKGDGPLHVRWDNGP